MYNGHRCSPPANYDIRNKVSQLRPSEMLLACPVAQQQQTAQTEQDGVMEIVNGYQVSLTQDSRLKGRHKGLRKTEVVMQRQENHHLGHSDLLSRVWG